MTETANMELLTKKTEQAERVKDIQELWLFLKRNLSPLMQARVKRRVCVDRWNLEKALSNEGIIFCRTKLDLSGAKELFESGVLTLDTESFFGGKRKPMGEVIAKLAGVDEVIYEKKGDSFVPRPKK